MQIPNESSIINKEKPKRPQMTKEIRQSHVLKWKQSGLTMSDYCRQNTLSISSFSVWVHQYTSAQSPAFKPVISQGLQEKRQQNAIEIISGDRVKIRLHDVNNAALVIEIIKEVMRCK